AQIIQILSDRLRRDVEMQGEIVGEHTTVLPRPFHDRGMPCRPIHPLALSDPRRPSMHRKPHTAKWQAPCLRTAQATTGVRLCNADAKGTGPHRQAADGPGSSGSPIGATEAPTVGTPSDE